MGSPPLGFCRPACGFWRCGNDGLTRHRTACHGRRPDVVKTGHVSCARREVRTYSAARLGRRRTETWSGHWEVRSLCFTRELARLPLDAERRQARRGAAGRRACGR
ncbi:hypothetical protein BCY84_12265 [Trypanosoma cruzi cruzi]|nr:hypothetical protein BCY84_12265 [Trypanosoma cruzi cruzi]